MQGSYLSRLAAQLSGLEEAVGVQRAARQKAESELAAAAAEMSRRCGALQSLLDAAQLEAAAARKAAAERYHIERERDEYKAKFAEIRRSRDAAWEASHAAEALLRDARAARDRSDERADRWESEAERLYSQVAELEAERHELAERRDEQQLEIDALQRALEADPSSRPTAEQLRRASADADGIMLAAERSRLQELIQEVEVLDQQAARCLWYALRAKVTGRGIKERGKEPARPPPAEVLHVEWEDPGTKNVLRLETRKGERMLRYTVSGEPRPPVRDVSYSEMHGTLEFPSIGRGATLPAAPAERDAILRQLRVLCALSGAEHDISDPTTASEEQLCWKGLRSRTNCGECGRGPFYAPARRCIDCGSALYYGTGSALRMWDIALAVATRRRRDLVAARRLAAACAVHVIKTAEERGQVKKQPQRRKQTQQFAASSPEPQQTEGEEEGEGGEEEEEEALSSLRSGSPAPGATRKPRVPRVQVTGPDHFEECKQRAEQRVKVDGEKRPWWKRQGRQAWGSDGSPTSKSSARSGGTDADATTEEPAHSVPRSVRSPPSVPRLLRRGRRGGGLRPAPPPGRAPASRSRLKAPSMLSAERRRRHRQRADGLGRDRALRPLQRAEMPVGGKWAPVSKGTGRTDPVELTQPGLAAWIQSRAAGP